MTSSKVNFVFDKKAGVVASYKVGGTEYFNEGFGIQPNFWRAPNDNDYGSGNPKRLEIWELSSRNFNVTSATGEIIDGNAIVKVDYKLPAGNQFLVTYKIYPDGIMNVATHFTPAHLDGVKIGISEATATATFSPAAPMSANATRWSFRVSAYVSVCRQRWTNWNTSAAVRWKTIGTAKPVT